MGYSEVLHSIHAAISSQSADLGAKIERLRRAKNEIDNEQNVSLGEIKKTLQPELGDSWNGTLARKYDDARDEAFSVMQEIINDDYERYKERIETKINMLEVERTAMSLASAIAHEANGLLSKGEEAVDRLENTISDLKRRVF
ncbi:DUF5082 family protein [Bacillus sp. CECT 9360]|uniref:YwqH-like family protein n=1 Tax=Bacillus sp. CECT 9360 TaxID=2845821 RepID=UPI001E2EC846|nr:DUF5082 family protein [Bacillus sp. CECT 9360]CAH0345748.1 hypothetical protein BCI9360_02046 [Bacillus sp. CECT 9360]